MSTEAPLVSVIIPTYNAGRFVGQAVQSVLEQTYRPYEIIVVDDGSTDGTKDVLQQFNNCIKYLYQENRGPSAARNEGIKIAAGEYICFLDADDLWTPNKLEAQIALMERSRHIGLVFSDHEQFDGDRVVSRSFLAEKAFCSELIRHTPIQRAFEKLVVENFISTPTVMIRKECLDKVGLFDESVKSIEDLDMWLRISAHFEIACLPLILCKRRIHNSNISRVPELSDPAHVMVLENNHRRFPDLASAAIWNRQLAEAYFNLGYHLLAKDQRMEALRAGFKGLRHALAQGITNRPSSSYPWIMAIGLLLAPFMGWRMARSLWRAKNNFAGFFRFQP